MNTVVFCKYRIRRKAQGSGHREKGVILPGGIWTCTSPNGHCSCVAVCGIDTRANDYSPLQVQGVDYESDKGKRRSVHILSA